MFGNSQINLGSFQSVITVRLSSRRYLFHRVHVGRPFCLSFMVITGYTFGTASVVWGCCSHHQFCGQSEQLGSFT